MWRDSEGSMRLDHCSVPSFIAAQINLKKWSLACIVPAHTLQFSLFSLVIRASDNWVFLPGFRKHLAMLFCNLIYSMKWSERTQRVFFFLHKPRLGVAYIDSSLAGLHHFRWCTQPINTFVEDPLDAAHLCFQTRASKNLIQSCPWCVIEHSGFCLLIVLIWSFKSMSDDAKIQHLSAPPVPHHLCFLCRSWTMSILKIHAREIFDSRGNPTVEVDLYTKKGTVF